MSIRLPALALVLAAAPLAAQETAFVVLPFEAQQSFGLEPGAESALSAGLSQLLASELERSEGGKAVPRAATREAAEQQGAGAGRARVDAMTAARVGKLVGAHYAITGNFVTFYDKFRLNVRVVDAATGEIIRGLSNDDPELQDRTDMYAAVHAVASRILKELGLPVNAAPAAAVTSEAVVLYGRGVEAEDAGDRSKAAGYFSQALARSPGFPEAQEASARVR